MVFKIGFNLKDYRQANNIFSALEKRTSTLFSNSDYGKSEIEEKSFKKNDEKTLYILKDGSIDSVVNIGGSEQKQKGDKISVKGFLLYVGKVTFEKELKYHFNLFEKKEKINDSIICHLTKRSEPDSFILFNQMVIASVNPKQAGFNDGSNSKSDYKPNPLTLYGTLQQSGYLFLEIDGAQIGTNLIYHNYSDNNYGFRNK